jgi:hypothetical protein
MVPGTGFGRWLGFRGKSAFFSWLIIAHPQAIGNHANGMPTSEVLLFCPKSRKIRNPSSAWPNRERITGKLNEPFSRQANRKR